MPAAAFLLFGLLLMPVAQLGFTGQAGRTVYGGYDPIFLPAVFLPHHLR